RKALRARLARLRVDPLHGEAEAIGERIPGVKADGQHILALVKRLRAQAAAKRQRRQAGAQQQRQGARFLHAFLRSFLINAASDASSGGASASSGSSATMAAAALRNHSAALPAA